MNTKELSPPLPPPPVTPCSALNLKDETSCNRRGIHADRHNPERYRCAVHHKAKRKSHRQYKALGKEADSMWEETKDTRGVVDIQASLDLVWLEETRTWLERFHATLAAVVERRERHSRLFYSTFEPAEGENHQRFCETLRYRMGRATFLLGEVQRRERKLRKAQAVVAPVMLDQHPHSPLPPVPETTSRPSAGEIDTPSLQLGLSQINVPSEDWEEDTDIDVRTLDSPISSYSTSGTSSSPSPTGSRASLLSFEVPQNEWPSDAEEDEEQEGRDEYGLGNSKQDALGVPPSQGAVYVKSEAEAVGIQDGDLVPPPLSDGLGIEPRIPRRDDLGGQETPDLEPPEESKDGLSHDEKGWMPGSSSLGWGIALTGAVAAVAVLNLTMRSRNVNLGQVVKDVARRISSAARH